MFAYLCLSSIFLSYLSVKSSTSRFRRYWRYQWSVFSGNSSFPTYLPIYLPTYPPTYLPPTHPPTNPSTYLPSYQINCLSVCLSVYLFVCVCMFVFAQYLFQLSVPLTTCRDIVGQFLLVAFFPREGVLLVRGYTGGARSEHNLIGNNVLPVN